MLNLNCKTLSELKGGLVGWKAIGGPTEGSAEVGYDASAAEYNVKARLDKHRQLSSKKSKRLQQISEPHNF